jgi:hypothetical protein
MRTAARHDDDEFAAERCVQISHVIPGALYLVADHVAGSAQPHEYGAARHF